MSFEPLPTSVLLGVAGLFIGRGTTILSDCDDNDDADQRQYDSCGDEPIISVSSPDLANLANDEETAERPTDYPETDAEQLEWGDPFLRL
jgi:hypothetical protein